MHVSNKLVTGDNDNAPRKYPSASSEAGVAFVGIAGFLVMTVIMIGVITL